MMLDERERRALALASQGNRREDVGRALYLSPGRVKEVLAAARKKLGAASTAHAVAIALREGLI